ncbi:MAG: GAF domain-containing protein [Actinomycetota bacterium]|nr:GAF domain-containing protein [Actinomycetota bacterium]
MSDLGRGARVEALDVFVELFDGLESGPDAGARDFYDRCCEAVCRLTSMTRAGLLLYDDARKLVVPVGSYGLPPELLDQIYGTLEEAPVAQRALAEDRVIELSGDLRGQLPDRYAGFGGLTNLTCTPVSAAGRWLGVLFADRGGEPFTLTESKRHAMWTLGKTAALAASARNATAEQARARLLSERIGLAREVHERVIQRVFGVSLVLGSGYDLGPEERVRCSDELGAALNDLRSALSRPLAPSPPGTGATLREELRRLGRHYESLPLEVSWTMEEPLPSDLEPLAQSVLAEALRNAAKHGSPSRVAVEVSCAGGAMALEVRNDGVEREDPVPPGGAGMGLRLAAFEALQRGGVVEFGGDNGEWRTRLVLPLP